MLRCKDKVVVALLLRRRSGGGAGNAIWRTQVFRAILLERRGVRAFWESERAALPPRVLTRETRKQKGVVGVRLEPLNRPT